ncbi:MAG TPA: hybrid sensor histidine kinase/response regulator [Porphyromonadaceae bacterium]|jgi:signal transduction histidine kinase/DNA-binding response OmpR family regulator/streptogramin lyase|nr:hybrid sensor histidine kinase/response regulator [Porphyromonadaceae bacterium]
MNRLINLIAVFLWALTKIVAQDMLVAELPNLNQIPTSEIRCFYHDSEGFMWYGTEGSGLCRDDGYMVKVFRADINSPKLLESNSITCITEDQDQKIWFGTKRGAYILDKNDYSIIPVPDQEIRSWVIRAIRATSDGSIWIALGGYVYRYDSSGARLGKYEMEYHNDLKEIRNIYEDDQGTVWMMQWRGSLFRYEAEKDQLIPYSSWPYEDFPTSIVKDVSSPYYWIGTWGNGIVRFDPHEKDSARMFVAQPASTVGINIAGKRIYNIVQDSTRNYLWITTLDNVRAYEITANDTLRPVDLTTTLPKQRKIAGNNILCDRLGNIWVADLYLNSAIISFLSNKIIKYPVCELEKVLNLPVNPTAISRENDYFWIKQKYGGLFAYNPRDGHSIAYKNRWLSTFFEEAPDSGGVYTVMNDSIIMHAYHDGKQILRPEIYTLPMQEEERIRTLHHDQNGNLWIGTTYHLLRYDLTKKQLHREYENIGIINKIITSESGNIFLVTESEGFWKLSDGKVVYKYNTEENYLDLTVSPDNNVWFCTQSGNVYCYTPSTNRVARKTLECGLNGDIVSEIESDNEGNIWMLTARRLIIYSPKKQTYNLIHSHNPSISFNNFLSLSRGTDGKMYVAGVEGIVAFNPTEQLSENTAKSLIPISWTFIKVNDSLRLLSGKSNKITLKPDERNVELFFSTFDPLNTSRIRYAFRYKNAGENWNQLPVQQNSIFLAGLSKGKHEIEVIATDENGIWSESAASFFIQRLPAWYETRLANTVYVILLITATVFSIEKYLRYRHEKHRKQLEEQVTQMKYRFFTNISHELRTPLTLIITPLDSIIRNITDPKLKQQLESIGRNAQNLLGLFNQLLNFRKIEMGGEAVHLSQGDMIDFVFLTYQDFRLIAEEKKINFEFHSQLDSLFLYFDAKKIKKVLNNLLSNAFKFTSENGFITLSVRKEKRKGRDHVVISVKDTGKGIPSRELPKVFERFYQADNQDGNSIGSGIGLHLAKEYVEMHKGHVTVQSEINKGSTFSVSIPTDLQPSVEHIHACEEKSSDVSFSVPSDLSRKILVVEDNTEFRAYLKNELSQYYTVFEAVDGLKGEMEAIDKEPDLIITDLMMPGINGIELCKRIKNNIEISHIPVILLTANNDIEYEKQGYKEGADAYISKPFLWDILLSRMENLMNQVLQRKQAFGEKAKIIPEKLTISRANEQFLTEAIALIEKNLDNSEYSVEKFSRDMCMSRTNLYRKINSITGMTPSEFTRHIRLKKSAELIEEGLYPIVEIAEKVGFNTHSYFSKSFKEMFGISPSEYLKKA